MFLVPALRPCFLQAQATELKDAMMANENQREMATLRATEAEHEIERQAEVIFKLECELETAAQDLVVEEARGAELREADVARIRQLEQQGRAAAEELQGLYSQMEDMERELEGKEVSRLGLYE